MPCHVAQVMVLHEIDKLGLIFHYNTDYTCLCDSLPVVHTQDALKDGESVALA